MTTDTNSDSFSGLKDLQLRLYLPLTNVSIHSRRLTSQLMCLTPLVERLHAWRHIHSRILIDEIAMLRGTKSAVLGIFAAISGHNDEPQKTWP